MCGICGIVSPHSASCVPRVERMLDRLAHRGPDGRGIWQSSDGRVTLGHARLAIVDLSDAAAQPMTHPAGISAVVNGEIYNYPALRRSLEHDACFASDCDSEIVLHGHVLEGTGFLPRLNGMFAFGLCDERDGSVVLARDRLGIKPLYYLLHGGELVFASEIKALFGAIETTVWDIDPQGLTEYMTYQSPLGDRTLFSGVRQVTPGSFIRLDSKAPTDIEVRPFWSLAIKPDPSIDFREAVERFDTVFEKSVDRHLLSDVPVASYLSAGFDSASVFARATQRYQRETGNPLAAFTGRFDGYDGWYDETGPARILARSLGAPHHTVDIDSKALIADLDHVIDALDEPRMGIGAFSQYCVAKAAAKDYKVILTGHGGDELFSGYPVFAYAENGLAGLRKLSEVPHFGYFFLSALSKRFRSEMGSHLPVLWPVEQQAQMTSLDKTVLQPWTQLETWLEGASSASDRVLLTYLKAYLPGLLLVEDKISMAHSLESRTPLLGNEMLELSLSIPPSVKLNGGVLKAIVKQQARQIFPEIYFSQPKRGFPTPLRGWLRGELADMITRRLGADDSHLGALFDPHMITTFVSEYMASWRRHVRPLDEIQSHRMWQLLSLESWLRNWSEKYGITLKLA